ncbi:MAG: metallophosphoesterase [Acidobacteria bacterium]|nr:metallophosphoesterase [Acidobacteriota bacterium]
MNRRDFLIRAGAGTGAALALGGTAYAMSPNLRLERITMRFPRLPEQFDGFKVLQLSDLHMGTYDVCVRLLEEAVDAARREKYEVLAITGDFLDQLARNRAHGVETGLRRLQPLLKQEAPVLFVPGNHDNSARLLDFRQELESAGMEILVNRAHTLERDGGRIHLIGLDDMYSGRYDFDAATAGVPQDEFRILLQHNPDYVEYHEAGRYDLQLSGHFHGGQIRLPLLGAPAVPSRFGRKYLCGIKEHKGHRLYVTRGIGMTLIPLRVDCPAEVSLIELRVGSESPTPSDATQHPARSTQHISPIPRNGGAS